MITYLNHFNSINEMKKGIGWKVLDNLTNKTQFMISVMVIIYSERGEENEEENEEESCMSWIIHFHIEKWKKQHT